MYSDDNNNVVNAHVICIQRKQRAEKTIAGMRKRVLYYHTTLWLFEVGAGKKGLEQTKKKHEAKAFTPCYYAFGITMQHMYLHFTLFRSPPLARSPFRTPKRVTISISLFLLLLLLLLTNLCNKLACKLISFADELKHPAKRKKERVLVAPIDVIAPNDFMKYSNVIRPIESHVDQSNRSNLLLIAPID